MRIKEPLFVLTDFFSTIIHVFATKVPSDIEFSPPSKPFTPPHLVLAQSLVDVFRQPLKLVARTHQDHPDFADVTMHSFIADVASRSGAPFIHDYIIPSLKAKGDFPRAAFLTRLQSASSGGHSTKKIRPNVSLLATLSSLLSDFTGKLFS